MPRESGGGSFCRDRNGDPLGVLRAQHYGSRAVGAACCRSIPFHSSLTATPRCAGTPRSCWRALSFQASSGGSGVLDGINTLKAMQLVNARAVPNDAPTGFVKPRWERQVFAEDGGIDRRLYELCALSELKNALRSGDMWVPGSRQFKDFEEYLLPHAHLAALQESGDIPTAFAVDGARYVRDRLALLTDQLHHVDRLAASSTLPDAQIADEPLKVKPLTKSVPEEAERLEADIYSLAPHLKITELLLEVDQWTNFSQHFTHLRAGTPANDRSLLLTVILADAINLGLTKMAEVCPERRCPTRHPARMACP